MKAQRPRVAILYGFCEGPAISKKLRRVLEDRGFIVVKDAQQADIILAHSGGCFVVPPDNHAKLIVLVGIPFWPSKSLASTLLWKNREELTYYIREYMLGAWLRKFLGNSWYFWNISYNLAMLHGLKGTSTWSLPASRTVVIRNKNDVMCTPNLNDLPFQEQPTYHEPAGQHDDCWLHPEIYADIVQSEYATRLLAQTNR